MNPVADVDPLLTAEGVPSSVSAFYRDNSVFKFRLDRPYHSGDKNDDDVKVILFVITDAWYRDIFSCKVLDNSFCQLLR